MPKFKKGDKVITLDSKYLSAEQRKLIGESSTIITHTDYWITNDGTIGYNDNEIILEEIYNSPLYKVMSEK